MKTYQVTITETLKKTVEVEANSREEAEQNVGYGWKECDYILDAENFSGVTFHAKEVKELER